MRTKSYQVRYRPPADACNRQLTRRPTNRSNDDNNTTSSERPARHDACTHMRLFDTFVFGQRERAILNLRVDTTCGVVDHIVIAIGTTSLSGDALTKPHLSMRNIGELRARCTRTPIHVVRVETTPPKGTRHRSWHALGMQINALAIKARQLGMEPSDVLVVSEHDEIPSPALLRSLRSAGGLGAAPSTAKLTTSFFYMYHGGCSGGYDWNAGFVANGAALNLMLGRDRQQWVVLPPSTTHNYSWPEAEDSDGQVPLVVSGSVHGQHRRYPYIDLMSLRLSNTHKLRGIDRHRAALGMAHRGLIPKEQQTHGFPADGFPPPHFLLNASWHLTTFMPPEDVLHKVKYAAHTECNVAPFNKLTFQQEAQRTCAHFCAKAPEKPPHPIEVPGALSPDAYPPAICRAEYSRYAPHGWCARYHSSTMHSRNH